MICNCYHEEYCSACLPQNPTWIAYMQSKESKMNQQFLDVALAEFRFGFFIARLELI